MSRTPAYTVYDIADYFGLAIEYADILPDTVCGHLDPANEPRYIVVNPAFPRHEQVFTIAHEIAHYVLHGHRPPREYFRGLLDGQWKSRRITRAAEILRRWLRRHFDAEWHADLYALGLLGQLKGHRHDLKDHLQHHPQKSVLFFVVSLAFVFGGLRRRLRSAFTASKTI